MRIDNQLAKKIRHPALWSVALVRIFSGLFFFVNPWSAWLLFVLLDILDSFPWRYIAGLTSDEYEIVDKHIDIILYFLMLLASLGNKFFTVLVVLFIFRIVGQLIFTLKKDEKFLFLFPNVFETFWLWSFVLPLIKLPLGFHFLIQVRGLVLLLAIKLVQEIFKHYWGPKYIFSKTSKLLENATIGLRSK